MTIIKKYNITKHTIIKSWNPAVNVSDSTLIIDGADPSNMFFGTGLDIGAVFNKAENKDVVSIGQSVVDYRPTYIANGLNGKGIIRYDGINDWLEATSVLGSHLFSTNEFTLFMVMKQNILQATRSFNWEDSGNTKTIDINNPYINGFVNFDAPYPSGRISQGGHGGKIDWAIWTFIKESDTSSAVYYNGELLFRDTYASASISMVDSFNLYISDKSLPMSGDIADIILYKRKLTTNEFNSVYRYLKNKRDL